MSPKWSLGRKIIYRSYGPKNDPMLKWSTDRQMIHGAKKWFFVSKIDSRPEIGQPCMNIISLTKKFWGQTYLMIVDFVLYSSTPSYFCWVDFVDLLDFSISTQVQFCSVRFLSREFHQDRPKLKLRHIPKNKITTHFRFLVRFSSMWP